MSNKAKTILMKIQQEKPFLLNIINYYPMDLIASGLRSIGVFPLMSNAEQEIDELLDLARAVVINLGKLDDSFVELCNRICQSANASSKPIVLDPVGAGVSRYRTDVALNFIKNHNISVVRGYSNELASLLTEKITVPNQKISDDNLVIENAKKLSEKYNIALIVSGKFNTVIDGNKMDKFNFDSSLLQKVAGIDSLLSAIIGAFHTVESDRFTAARSAIGFYGNCVGSVTCRAQGPASLKTALIDKLYTNASQVMEW
ncbi:MULTISPECIES: hydroxyethylthiazole kinase [Legionella]|uniref:hydroxyethylthiazole kinase n=1 Tax=Legionella maceachernii TaxID=466 RepID=A0A0W0VYS8_9GAMM|nr:hydroxyethylthiazole kinase [Legionella maceachernii]KTD25199.1 hydroxyethylthiazole kinase [Legionella maceachernii]SJZ76228.1 hydroxyethylthiazole kinase [Legionella maceachernii]SUP03133.1 Hydroxyethylthiazole kinase [Legionella maceachernii]